MTKKYSVCGLGNGIVDILVQVDDSFLLTHKLSKGTMGLVDEETQHTLLSAAQATSPVMASGGSVANSIIAIAQLGGTAAFQCRLGDDRYGLHYKSELEQLGIELSAPLVVGRHSGTSLVLITPDGERTMCTCLSASAEISIDDLDAEVISNSEWLFIEGYLIANGEGGQRVIQEAIKIARESNVKIALTLSEAFVVHGFRSFVDQILPNLDLIIANEHEAAALTAETGHQSIFAKLTQLVPAAFMTCGAQGAWIRYHDHTLHVPAVPCEPKDLTGAGDMFAGSMLYGITHGVDLEDAARAACFLAMKVISRVGARLHSGTREYWNSIVQG